MNCVIQPWALKLTFMQQSVLMTAVRAPDGLPKYHPSKYMLRWYRRCFLYSAMDKCIITNPTSRMGGSFTGPLGNENENWEIEIDKYVIEYLRTTDEIPHHFQMHFMHATQIVGYKHDNTRIRIWWLELYNRLVNDMYLWPENEAAMDRRLGDNREQWLERSDPATAV